MVILYTRVRHAAGSNLCHITSYTDWGASWIPLAAPCEFLDSSVKHATKDSKFRVFT
jgi:hypothetical protein